MSSNTDDEPSVENQDLHTSLDSAHDTLTLKENERPESAGSLDENILRQIDFYFSDENLRCDDFLFSKMHGRKNLPVPISLIHSFKKMSNYSTAAVLNAVEKSQRVDLVDNGTVMCIQRKVPFIKTNTKKKSKKKSKGTGFEEYWADAPVTPDEFKKEQDLYSTDLPFSLRIETAIQRYQKKRKFDSLPLAFFTKWIKYGGFYTGPKQFTGGLDPAALDSMDATEIAAMTATTYAGDDKLLKGKDALWAIEFETVAKGFLSSAALNHYEFDTQEKAKQCINVLRNFYNYIMHHNVCIEYTADILAARNVCDLAEKELYLAHKASHPLKDRMCLPGDFNSACSFLFGGIRGDSSWDGGYTSQTYLGLNDAEASRIFISGYEALGDKALLKEDEYETKKVLMSQEVTEVEEDIGLEVTAIEPSKEGGSFGILRCRSWALPDFAGRDLPVGIDSPSPPVKAYDFWIEEEILQNCFVGMKIEGTVHTLTSGLKFLENVTAVWCSFYTVLENELLKEWKDPKYVTREDYLEKLSRGEDREGEAQGSDDL